MTQSDQINIRLTSFGFTETTYRRYYFFGKKKTAFKYQTIIDQTTYTLTVFESEDKIVVISDMVGVGPFKLKYESANDAMNFITERVRKWNDLNLPGSV